MLWVIIWIIISFFAVLGLLECMLFFVELFGLRKLSVVESASFRVVLKGETENPEYLLNTLALMSERVDIGTQETVLEIIDGGITDKMSAEILEYCQKNPWVRFTSKE